MSAGDGKSVCSSEKINTVVFDLGGVLFTEGKSVALEVLSGDYGYDRTIVWNVLTCEQSRDMRKGLLSEEAFWSWAAGQVPKGYDAQLIRDEWWKGYALDPEILKLVKRLKGHYRLVAFSENVCSRIVYLDQRYHFRELFDEEIYSYDHHFGKCDPEFLDILLTTLGDRPDEILYIDNSKVPLEMAEKLGMKVIHYTTGQKKSIEAVMRCLGISSDAGPSLITT